MQGFSRRHPLINFIFFVLVLAGAMIAEHPAIVLTGLFFSVVAAIALIGAETFARRLLFVLPLMFVTALINPLVSHSGQTVLFSFPSGNACTMESVLYGVFAGVRLGTVLFWFFCWNAVITSDKFVYLFGRRFAALALTVSMALRFVPQFLKRFREVSDAQSCLHPGEKGLRHAGRVFSAVIQWALENALHTADAMKARGYGLPHRTSFSVYRFTAEDTACLLFMLLLGAGTLAGALAGGFDWSFYPQISGAGTAVTAGATACFGLLAALPLISEAKEVLQWRLSRSKT